MNFVPHEVTKRITMMFQKSKSRPKKAINYDEAYKQICKNSWEDEYTRLHKHLLETKQNKFLVYDCGHGGWGNHIAHMLLAFQIAVITKRAYVDVCTIPIPTDRYLKPRHIKWNYKLNETGLTVGKGFVFSKENVKIFSDSNSFQELLTHSVEYEPIFLRIAQFVLPLHINFKNRTFSYIYQAKGCSFYYLFKKSDTLQKQVEEWKEQLGFNDNIVLAIHIRHGDSIFSGKFNLWDVRLNGTKDYDFIYGCAEQIEKKISEKYHTKKIIWFLATDTDSMRSYTKTKYGKKVRHITGPIEHIGRPREGFEDAGQLTMLLDYFLLQESDYRLYTSVSSFDNAIDFMTFGNDNAGRIRQRWGEKNNVCVFPPSLKN